MLNCPRDGTNLTTSQMQGIEVDRCPQCNGCWLDHDELDSLEGTVASEEDRTGMIDYAKRESELDCPVCKKRMTAFNYRAYNLELDACPEQHGFWLDAGEEARVREVIEERVSGLARAATAEEAWAGMLRGGSGGIWGSIKRTFGGK